MPPLIPAVSNDFLTSNVGAPKSEPMFGGTDPVTQRANQVREQLMNARAKRDLEERLHIHRNRPVLQDPEDFTKAVMKKPQMAGQPNAKQQTGNAVRQGEMANMQQKGNLPRYGNSDLGAPQIIDALRMRGGVGPTAQQWGFPDRPAIDPGAFTLAMMLQQRQRNAPGSLGRMVPNLAPSSAPAQPEPVYRPFDPVLAANIQSKNAKIRADKKANRSQADLDAEAMQLAQNKQEYQQALANMAAERSAAVQARQKARADIKNFGIDPEQAYWNRGVPMGGQMSPEQRTMLMLKQGQAMSLPQEAVNQMALAQQYKEARLAEEVKMWATVAAQAATPEAFDLAQSNIERLQRLSAGGATQPLGPMQAIGSATPSQKPPTRTEASDAVKTGVAMYPNDPYRAAEHVREALGVSAADADMLISGSAHKHAKDYKREYAERAREAAKAHPAGPQYGAILGGIARLFNGDLDKAYRGIAPLQEGHETPTSAPPPGVGWHWRPGLGVPGRGALFGR